jgi:GNAT superfamily N-acetyltransferase
MWTTTELAQRHRAEEVSAAATTTAAPAETSVRPASSDADWREARALVMQLLGWIESETGHSLVDVQPDAIEELHALSTFYGAPSGRMIVARLNGPAVGTTGVHVIAPGIAELKRVYVHPSARGHKFASRMLVAAMDAAREMGADRVRLETYPPLMGIAHRMYLRVGFEPIAPYSTLEQAEGVVAMERSLNKPLPPEFAALREV